MSEYLFVDGRRIGVNEFTAEVAKTAKRVEARGLKTLTSLPPMPAATVLWLDNLPLLAEADTSAATVLWLDNLPLLAEADTSAATVLRLDNLPLLAEADTSAATDLWLLNLPLLAEADTSAATDLLDISG